MWTAMNSIRTGLSSVATAATAIMQRAAHQQNTIASYATKIPTMGRAKRGLFGGKDVISGNNVSFSNRKTRRLWKPNVQNKSFYSELLGEKVSFRVTTYAMRCIDKAGGIDNYLLKAKDEEILYDRAIKLRDTLRALARKKREGESAKSRSSAGETA